ncbi:MAG: hypothetical protein ABH863_05650 [Candidatus Micrarchaeota archaeon]
MQYGRGQTNLEYMLLLGGALLVLIAAFMVVRSNVLGISASQTENTSETIGDILVSVQGKAPVISNPSAKAGPGIDGETITWDTDVPSSSTVNYGISPDTDKYAGSTAVVIKHSIILTDLDFTDYSYKVSSCSPTGGCTTSGTLTFTLIAPTDTPTPSPTPTPSSTGIPEA